MNLQPYRFVPTHPVYRRGIGSLGACPPTGSQTAEGIAKGGAGIAGGIAATFTALAATTVSVGAVTAGIGAAVVGLVVLADAIYNQFKGCGATCTEASAIANQIEPILLKNLQTYMAAPVHYASLQALALNNFQTAWNSLVAGCSAAGLCQAGQNCIVERETGGCQWRTATPYSWANGVYVPPGPQVSSGGACWNWWVGYHDPIANDPTVVPDPVPGAPSSTGAGGTVATSQDLVPVLLIAAVVLGALLL